MLELPFITAESIQGRVGQIIEYLTKTVTRLNTEKQTEGETADRVISIEQSGSRLCRKWASGLMEQWYRVKCGVTGGTQWGSLYYDSATNRVKYEPAFLNPPYVTLSVSGTKRDMCLINTGEGTREYSPAFYFSRPVSTGFEGSYEVCVYAVGKWK